MTAESSEAIASHPVIAPPHWRGMPRRFFVGMVLLYAMVMGNYVLVLSPLRQSIPAWRSMTPFLACGAFYICGGIFLLIFGRGLVSRWSVLISIVVTFTAGTLLSVALHAQQLHDATDPSRTELRALSADVARGVNWIFSRSNWIEEALNFAAMPCIEEAVKLSPVFVLILLGRIRTPHGAMLCGALSGLTFGVVEAITYGLLIYPGEHQPVTTYLTRFLVMAPMHGVWDALAGGLTFFLSGGWQSTEWRAPTFGACVTAYIAAASFHIAHNALQAVNGPAMQIATVFVLLAPLYLMSRSARRRVEMAGQPIELPFIGDLHLLMISMATLFLAASLLFCWAMGLVPTAAGSAI